MIYFKTDPFLPYRGQLGVPFHCHIKKPPSLMIVHLSLRMGTGKFNALPIWEQVSLLSWGTSPINIWG